MYIRVARLSSVRQRTMEKNDGGIHSFQVTDPWSHMPGSLVEAVLWEWSTIQDCSKIKTACASVVEKKRTLRIETFSDVEDYSGCAPLLLAAARSCGLAAARFRGCHHVATAKNRGNGTRLYRRGNTVSLLAYCAKQHRPQTEIVKIQVTFSW